MSIENKDYENKVEKQDELDLGDESRVRTLSPTMLVLKRFIRNRLAITGMIFIVGMFIFSFIGGFLMPYSETEVFKKYEGMYKVYAGITENENLRYVIDEGVEFTTLDISQFVLATSQDLPIFESGDTLYAQRMIDEDFYMIYSVEEIGLTLSLRGDVSVNTTVDGLGEDFNQAVIGAIGGEETVFDFDGGTYIIEYNNKNNVLYRATPIVVASKNVYDYASVETSHSFDFAAAVERGIREEADSIEVDGVTYTLGDNEGMTEVSLDGNLYANISRYSIEPFYEDSFFALDFKARIREAVQGEEETFLYDEKGEGQETFRLYRQNLQWTLEHEESTYLVDEYSSPSTEHLLGTDGHGMDILTRLMYGGRISLRIGFLVVAISTTIGIILGGMAGYFGKWVDMLIMRIVDTFNCIPSLPLFIIIGSVLDQLRIDPQIRLNMLMLILAVLSWPGIARMVRGQILSLREQEFMTATEATGIRVSKRIFKHLIPNVIPQLIVICTLSLGSVILTESVLSFLGVGVKFPFASWGNIINAVNNVHVLSNYTFAWIPAGICILITVLGFNFIGDGLRDAFDPKAKR